jgi:hypothetical protein
MWDAKFEFFTSSATYTHIHSKAKGASIYSIYNIKLSMGEPVIMGLGHGFDCNFGLKNDSSLVATPFSDKPNLT